MSIQEDHIHLVVQLPPQYSVAEVVQIFKGGTSRVLRKEYPELEAFLWGDSFWADGLNNTNRNILAIPPLGYLDFLCLMSNAAIVLTDSGGIQY